MLTGQNGILKKAGYAENDTEIAKEKEDVELAYVSAAVNKLGGHVDDVDLQNELEISIGTEKTDTTDNDDGTLNVEFLETKHNYNVNNGTVTKLDDIVYGKEEWYTFSDLEDEDGIEITGITEEVKSEIEGLSTLEGSKYETLGNLPASYKGKNVISVGSYALMGYKLTSVVIPSSVVYLKSGAFCNNELTGIKIPKSVEIIENAVFYNNRLTSVTIPKSVREISLAATFACNYNLSRVKFLSVPLFKDFSTAGSGQPAMFYGDSNLIENTISVPNGHLEDFKCYYDRCMGLSTQSAFYEE